MNVKQLREYLLQFQDDTPVMLGEHQPGQLCYTPLETYDFRHLGNEWDEDYKLYIG